MISPVFKYLLQQEMLLTHVGGSKWQKIIYYFFVPVERNLSASINKISEQSISNSYSKCILIFFKSITLPFIDKYNFGISYDNENGFEIKTFLYPEFQNIDKIFSINFNNYSV